MSEYVKCDADCSARSIVRTLHLNGELRWCGHHFDVNKTVLTERAISVTDERTPAAV